MSPVTPGHDDHTTDTPDDDYAADRCPSDPVGDGTHWFEVNGRCRYCGKLDMLFRTDPSPVVGGHGPHDDQPHWTVDEDGDPVWLPNGIYITKRDLGWHGAAHAALVRAVRDAAEIPALRTHATTLQRARELARELRPLPYSLHPEKIDALLDLLTGETDAPT